MLKILLVSIVLMACLVYPSDGAGAPPSPGSAVIGAAGEQQENRANSPDAQNVSSEDGAQKGQERNPAAEQEQLEARQETLRGINGTGDGSDVRGRTKNLTAANGMKEIQRYFVERVKNFSQNASPEDRARQVSQIRHEVNAAIKDYLETRDEANLSEMEGTLDEEISVTPTSISTDSFNASTGKKRLNVRVKGQDMQVEQEQDGVSFGAKGGVRAMAERMAIANGTLRVNGTEIGVLPSEAAKSLKGEVSKMKMVQQGGRLAYSAQVKVRAKLLGLFGTEYEKESVVDAQNGQLLGEKKPWWSIFATQSG